ncbi:Gx transporter family protein [bacterium]|nr:Gx transporter family protein [bacterium]RQV98677.1 MAG: Gx transporter family protein [bacterium]
MSTKLIQLTVIISIGSILFTLESFIPTPLPWIKLGLANVTTILVLKWYGLKEAFIVAFMRIVIGSLLTGRFLNPVFIISLSGNISAVVIMYFTIVYGEKMFSLIGVSILGAVFKSITQLFIVYLIYLRQIYLFSMTPIFLFSALVAGIFVGFSSHLILNKLKPYFRSGS